MSNRTRFAKTLNGIVSELESTLRSNGVSVPQDVIKGTYSQESAVAFANGFEDQTRELRTTIAEHLSELDSEFSQESLSADMSESMRAGLIAALASQGGATGYHKQALSSGDASQFSLESVYSGLGGDIDVVDGDAYSQESFDETELASFAAQNIMFNVLASRQDAFAEAFFPTKVVTPAEGGIQITVDRQEVLDYAQHKSDGSALGLKRSNLIDAFADHSILNRPATELVPWAKADNSNDAFFVAETEVGSQNLDISGTTVRTRPLKMGKKVNLLGLSSHPGLIDNGILDTTDQIAPGTRLKNLYVRLTLDGGVDPDTVEVIKLDVSNMTRNQFRKSHEGQGREVVLNFISSAINIDAATTTADGSAVSLLANEVATPDLAVQLALSVNGNGNLNDGAIDIHSSPVRVESVVTAGGEVLALDSGAGQAVVDRLDALSATVIGYDLAARRSNSNWRSTGALIDVTPYTESYAIQPGYPISVLTPTDDQQNGAKISGMINAARIRNSNNAITTLINYAEQLEAYKTAMERGVKLDIVGAGRHVVKPFFASNDLDVAARVSSISSHERADDVSAVLVDAIRDMAYRMYRESNYGPALDLANAGTQTKPTVLIGCDAVVQRYLMISGDDRLLGENMDYRIVATNDGRMTDNIYLTFTRERPGSEDGLSFGVHAYVPELIQRVTTSRNGSTAKNDRVVPRSIHVPVLPVVGHIRVQKLSEAIGNV